MLQPHSDVSSEAPYHAAERLLSERAVTALRAALQGQLRQSTGEESLRRALRALCADARQRDVLPEHLIRVFKSVWASLPEIQNRQTTTRQDLLDRVISISVEEYYAESLPRE